MQCVGPMVSIAGRLSWSVWGSCSLRLQQLCVRYIWGSPLSEKNISSAKQILGTIWLMPQQTGAPIPYRDVANARVGGWDQFSNWQPVLPLPCTPRPRLSTAVHPYTLPPLALAQAKVKVKVEGQGGDR